MNWNVWGATVVDTFVVALLGPSVLRDIRGKWRASIDRRAAKRGIGWREAGLDLAKQAIDLEAERIHQKAAATPIPVRGKGFRAVRADRIER